MRWRETRDLDLALSVTLQRYPAGLEREPGWSRHSKLEHRWMAPDGVSVDVIPAGGEATGSAVLRWPETGSEMSLVGLRLAFERAVPIHLADDLTVEVAPLEVVALLKMVAYQDRPSERERDLADLAYIMDGYVADGDDRRYGDDILDLRLSYNEVSPFLLGKRLAAVVNEQEEEAVRRFIELVKGTDDRTATQARMLVSAPPSWRRDPEELWLRVVALERGLDASMA